MVVAKSRPSTSRPKSAASPKTATNAKVAGAPPGPRRRDERLGTLLKAAAFLFVEQGASTTSIADIVLRAGVAKGTFYHYFQDRAAMMEALRQRYGQHIADVAQREMDAAAPDDWQGRLDAWIGSLVREYGSSYALHDVIFHDPTGLRRCVMGEVPFVRDLASLIVRGRQAGIWEAEDALATAVCMFHGAHGLLDEAIATGSDLAVVGPRLSRLFAKMLRPSGDLS